MAHASLIPQIATCRQPAASHANGGLPAGKKRKSSMAFATPPSPQMAPARIAPRPDAAAVARHGLHEDVGKKVWYAQYSMALPSPTAHALGGSAQVHTHRSALPCGWLFTEDVGTQDCNASCAICPTCPCIVLRDVSLQKHLVLLFRPSMGIACFHQRVHLPSIATRPVLGGMPCC